ncbi:MAG: Cob(I)yrinic acid a,c-diamide adenosyltransferase [Succiniclasticum sp.]|jgi:cob(I)alamin adenosyltransferase
MTTEKSTESIQEKLGLIHVYTGAGKGKTTAAMGLILRASGRGLKVTLLQFMKGRPTGELLSLQRLPGVQVYRAKEMTKFSFQMTEEEKKDMRQRHDALLQEVTARCREDGTDLLVLDEALGAVGTGLLDEDLLLDFLDHKPAHLEVVLTGRNPSPALLERADYVTEMVKRKHPFDKGIPARDGIEK